MTKKLLALLLVLCMAAPMFVAFAETDIEEVVEEVVETETPAEEPAEETEVEESTDAIDIDDEIIEDVAETIEEVDVQAEAMPESNEEIETETEEAHPNAEENQCGDNIYWSFDEAVLSIYGSGAMWDYDGDAPYMYYASDIEKVVVYEGVTSIGAGAFKYCWFMTEIELPSTLESIGEEAFAYTSIDVIEIPESVTYIGSRAFTDTYLTWVVLPEGLEYLADDAFDGSVAISYAGGIVEGKAGRDLDWSYDSECQTLTITGIGPMYDWNREEDTPWYDLRDEVLFVDIQGGSSIGEFAFQDFSELFAVNLPDTLKRIGSDAFANCSNLTEIYLPDRLEYIGSDAFYYCDLRKVNIPENVRKIGAWAFIGNRYLKTVTLGAELNEIGYKAFWDTGITSVKLPPFVHSLGIYAFPNRAIVSVARNHFVALEVDYCGDTLLKATTSNKKIVQTYDCGYCAELELKKAGTANLTYSFEEEDSNYVLKLKVVSDLYKATKVETDYTGIIELQTDETLPVYAYLTPWYSTSKVTCTSSNKAIAKIVSDDGYFEVVPLKEGTVTITVKTSSGKKTTFKVKVIDPNKATSIEVEYAGIIEMYMGETMYCDAWMEPYDSTSRVTWSSSSTKIAKVNGYRDESDWYSEIEAVKAGTATITAKTSSGKKATFKVKVLDPKKAQYVSIDQARVVEIGKGDTLQLTATMYPETATSKQTWTSSNKAIVTVSSTGVIKGIKNGTAKITVKTSTGKKDTITVKVVSEFSYYMDVYELLGKTPDSYDFEYLGLEYSDSGLYGDYYYSTNADMWCLVGKDGYVNDVGSVDWTCPILDIYPTNPSDGVFEDMTAAGFEGYEDGEYMYFYKGNVSIIVRQKKDRIISVEACFDTAYADFELAGYLGCDSELMMDEFDLEITYEGDDYFFMTNDNGLGVYVSIPSNEIVLISIGNGGNYTLHGYYPSGDVDDITEWLIDDGWTFDRDESRWRYFTYSDQTMAVHYLRDGSINCLELNDWD